MGFTVFRFVLIGPVTGCFAFLLISGLAEPNSLNTTTYIGVKDLFYSLWAFVAMSMYAIVFAYPFAAWPSALCGLLYWFLMSRYTSKNPSIPIRTIVGGFLGMACSAAFWLLFFSAPKPMGGKSEWLAWVAAGVFGGAMSAMTVGRNLYAPVPKDDRNAT